MIKLLVFLVIFSLNTPAFAEEVADNSGWDNNSGWAIVDESGIVQNVIVCTNSVCGENGEFNGVMPNDTPWAGMKIVRQLPEREDGNTIGYWGTYDNNLNHFVIDRSCSDCETWQNLVYPGIIKDGSITNPVFEVFEELKLQESLNIEEATTLIESTVEVYQATKFNATIKMSKNLKIFYKKSKTPQICKISNNKILIKKTGICKIEVSKNKKRKVVKMKVYK